MNFFKSVFSDDPDPPRPAQSQSPSEGDPSREEEAAQEPDCPSNSRWGGLGGLVKTLTTKSESVLETYRRDLQEFGLGLRKEIQVAHGSLENVGQAIDELGSSVLKGTSQIISQGKEAILVADLNLDSPDQGHGNVGNSSQFYRRYSRLDAQVRAIRGDVNTFSEEPEDSEDYGGWKLGFHLGEKGEEVEKLMEEDGPVRGFYYRLVPGSIDHDTFWFRYFYRVHKLEQAENVRASLVKRAISSEEEELTWDVYDDDDDVSGDKEVKKGTRLSNVVSVEAVHMDNDEDGNLGEAVKEKKDGSSKEATESTSGMGSVESKDAYGKETEDRADEKIGKLVSDSYHTELNIEESEEQNEENQGGESRVSPTPKVVHEKVENVASEDSGEGVALVPNDGNEPEEDVHLEKVSDVNSRDSSSGPQENLASNTIVEPAKSKESSPAAALSNSSAAEEEDLGWDEIEDLSSIDDQKVAPGGTPSANRADLRKRLSVAEEEEDLSWDIEDDDEPAKA
ncbi:BSD domain-containing protein 1-like [Rhodamnia argentea]|uniref:BSD domain-containing protein 1-like n=1 Tax=Rhodamnia argentea TaxID=178133 RepID=A0ABM3HR53_9MYRT|nr:BSD domain-containing protein 1-like [Rhodamnia argentea]